MSVWARRACWMTCSGLAACASAPVHYYTLMPPAAQTTQDAMSHTSWIDVRVAHLPAQSMRTELVVRSGNAEVVVLDNERWAAPLREQIQDGIRAAIQADPPASDSLEASRAGSMLDVVLDIDRWEAELGHDVTVEATWSARAVGGASSVPGAACTSRVVQPIGAGYSAVVEGFQESLRVVSRAIVDSLKTHTCR